MGKKKDKSKSEKQKRLLRSNTRALPKPLSFLEKRIYQKSCSKIKPVEKKKSKKNVLNPDKSSNTINTIEENKEVYKCKKIRLKALKYFDIKPQKDINKMNINELKTFAHYFDLNPKVNYKVLLYLKNKEPDDYNMYIDKYKYTLDFMDAIDLECISKEELKSTFDEFNKYINCFNLGVMPIDSIDKINSFSKIKVFNILLFLISNDSIFKELKEIEPKILSHSIPQSLIFKVPNKFGNIELQYYFYLVMITNILLPEKFGDEYDKDLSSSPKKKNIFFEFCTPQKPLEEEIILEKINKRKKALDEYLAGIETVEKTLAKKKNISKQKYIKAHINDKKDIFRKFENNIYEIIRLKNDDEILKRIRFLILLIIFYKGDDLNLFFLLECFKDNNYTSYEIENIESYLNEKTKKIYKKNNYKEIVLNNIQSQFESNAKNPFYYNSKYFSYPLFLEKNLMQTDKEILKCFKNFLKQVYNSPLIKDIFYMSNEFNDFLYPLEDDEIFEELFDLTNFLPFSNGTIMGFTQKEIPEVLIPCNLNKKEPSAEDFSEIICHFAQILNTCIHEHIKHYIKALIFYNSFPLGLKKRIFSDLHEINEEKKLVNKILKKNKNEYTSVELNDDEKVEVFMYGNLLKKIYFGQALELFKISNWDKTIPEHILTFNTAKNYNLQMKFCTLEQIINNDEFCDFFKIIAKKFKKYYLKKKGEKFIFNYAVSSTKSPVGMGDGENHERFKFDYSVYVERKQGLLRDSS